MITKIHLLSSIVLLLLTSCAFHQGTFDSGVAITNNQFRIAGTARGSAYTFHILGIGGLSKDALVWEAKRDLYSKYPLAKGMSLTNVSVDRKFSFYGVAIRTEVVINADIIDFNPERFDLPYLGFYTQDSTFFPTEKLPINTSHKNYVDKHSDYVRIGSTVYFTLNGSKIRGTVKDINSYGIKCEYPTKMGTSKIYLQPKYISLSE
jgi:hypothetical protein